MIILLIRREVLLAVVTLLLSFVTAPLLVVLILLAGDLLRLKTSFLLGAFVECRGEFFERTDQMDTEITLGFMGLLDGPGDSLNGLRELLEGVMNSLQAEGNVLEEFVGGVGIGGDHAMESEKSDLSEWAQEVG